MKISTTWDDKFARFLLSQNKEIAKVLVEAVLSEEEKPVRIKNIIPQMRMAHPEAHEVVYDGLIELEDGTQIDLEIQNLDGPDWIPRLFYNESFLIQRTLGKSEDYKDMRRRIVIGYCNFPVFDNKRAIYHIDHTVRENKGWTLDDRGQIILANGGYPDPQGLLKEVFHDMGQDQAEQMHLKPYKDTYEFLTTKKGEKAMSKWSNQFVIEYAIEVVKELMAEGFDKEKAISIATRSYTDEEQKADFLKELNLALQ